MAAKPSIPKGTRDFTPEQTAKRNYIFSTIREAFRLFGFKPIETPAMENLSTLMGKYGEEGDKLLFKILNSGDFTKNINTDAVESGNYTALASIICEKGLRYDLTVPFARFVVQHRNELQMPFKRYQIQPVWRADRPQKGRYREFYQCDADIVGSESLLNEAELLALIDVVFSKLCIDIIIKINNRKILTGIAEVIGAPEMITDITVAIDKIDKIGINNVNLELLDKGLSQKSIDALQPLLEMKGSNEEKFNILESILKNSDIGMKGIAEMKEVITNFSTIPYSCSLEVDVSLARGLNYYTGTILEVKAKNVEIGSISGGGRYDNLTGVFGMSGLSGVGISFGADRIYDVLTTLNLFPPEIANTTKVMFVNFGKKEATYAMKYAYKLRKAGISTLVYPDSVKMKKQMALADSENIPYVAIIGENEISNGTIMLKNMVSGEQSPITPEELIAKLK